MDTRLTELLPAALGLKNGDAKIIKNAGGLVISAFDSAMRSLIVAIYELGVEEIMYLKCTQTKNFEIFSFFWWFQKNPLSLQPVN